MTPAEIASYCPACDPDFPNVTTHSNSCPALLYGAATLGAMHGRAGTTPYGDLDLDDSPLMTALGETGPTTEDNHPRRLALLDAYRDAYQQATEG